MPQILEFSYRNVCSYGNKKQRIPFGKEPTLTLIVGDNGTGKSTIGYALEFSWYGKTRRRKISEIANWDNGNMETYNKFLTDDGRTVEVARGVDPMYVEVRVDGKPEDRASKPKMDQYIENELLGIPFDVCANTMILSINDFKSFVKIKAEDKRKIVDRIFGMDILNKMNLILKDELKQAKEDLVRVQLGIDQQKTVLQSTESQLEELKANLSVEADARKAELEGIIAAIDLQIKNNEATVYGIRQKIKDNEAHSYAISEKMRTEHAMATTEALEAMQKAETEVDTLVSGKLVQLEKEMSSILSSLDDQYAKTIESIAKEITDATSEAKRILDDKMSSIVTEVNAKSAEINAEHETKVVEIDSKLAARLDQLQDAYKESAKKISIGVEKLNSEHAQLTESINVKTGEISGQNARNSEISRKIKLYESGMCPECGSDLTTHEHGEVKTQLEADLAAGELLIEKLSEEILESKSRIAELGKLITAFSIEGEDNDKKYNEAVMKERNESSSGKELLMNERQSKLLQLAQYKSTSEASAKASYDEIISQLSGKQNELQSMSHERDMKKEKTRTDFALKQTLVAESANTELQRRRLQIEAIKTGKLAEIEKKMEEISLLQTECSNFNTEVAVLNSTNDSKRAQITLYNKELEEIEQKMKDNMSVKSLEQLVVKLNEQMIGLVASEVEHNSKIKLCISTQELLTEDGIKKKFMAMVLPVMNATIRRIIDEFQYKYNFHFDDNFDAVIERMGKHVSPESLSTGEEKMIDLIVVLAVMELIKMKHPKINVMFLDEVFASLDQNNIERTIKILREFMDKYNMTLFAISHTMMPKEYFDHIISVTNDGMFSDMKID